MNRENRHTRTRVGQKSYPQYKTTFAIRVYDVVRQIPAEETRTYKEVATLAGRPRAYRAVGNILNKNRDPNVPCHRVIRSDGTIGGYAWGTKKKAMRLRQEKRDTLHL